MVSPRRARRTAAWQSARKDRPGAGNVERDQLGRLKIRGGRRNTPYMVGQSLEDLSIADLTVEFANLTSSSRCLIMS
jgi:hypothetical protein